MTACKGLVRFILLAAMLSLVACASSPPRNLNDGCAIFREKDDWYEHANDSFKKWGVPVHVQLAIMHQESRFVSDALAPDDTLLGFIPWGQVSTAYGFAQVLDATWDWYIDSTGSWGADRNDFEDATDFIGWYGNISYNKLGISKWDAYNQYLAYHEGHGGWKRKTYNRKKWLPKVARKVERRAAMYRKQLARCKDDLDDGSWFW
jgi:hypothetical protein